MLFYENILQPHNYKYFTPFCHNQLITTLQMQCKQDVSWIASSWNIFNNFIILVVTEVATKLTFTVILIGVTDTVEHHYHQWLNNE